jgi:hypothetical protein
MLVLALCHDPVPLRRSWCLFEVMQTVSTSSELLIAMPAVEQGHLVE